MPRYGDKIFHPERRWEVVNYLRALQAQGGSTTPAAGATP